MSIIDFWGDTKGTSGYSVHGRELKKAMEKLGCKFSEDEHISVPCLAITTPEFWQLRSGNKHVPFMPFLIFEGTKMSKGWIDMCNENYIHKILVPSNYVKDVAIKSGVTKEIIVAPHGVNLEYFNYNVPLHPKIKDDNSFKFLMVGGWAQGVMDRKGFQFAIKAFNEEFKPEENVTMYWKINMGYNPNLNIKEEMKKLNLKNPKMKLAIIIEHLSEEELAMLYKTCNVLVAPSMADAFNIPCAESMSCGTPVIATDYSGMTDYVNKENGWLIPVKKFIKSPGEPKHIYEDAEWAIPSVEELRKIMRYAYEHPEECKSKGKIASEYIKNNYTWEKTALIIKKEFDNYGK